MRNILRAVVVSQMLLSGAAFANGQGFGKYTRADLEKLAVQMLLRMPSSSTANREVCLYDGRYAVPSVFGSAGGSWNLPGNLYIGLTSKFPANIVKKHPDARPLHINYSEGVPGEAPHKQIGVVDPQGGAPIFATTGFVFRQNALICAYEAKAILE